jgi:predicted nicotinamide N-methyase
MASLTEDDAVAEQLERILAAVATGGGALAWPGFAVTATAAPDAAVGAGTAAGDGRLVAALDALRAIATRRRRHCVALRLAGVLPPVVGLARDPRPAPSAHAAALRLLGVMCADPVCCEEVGWLGGHHQFLREIMDGSEEAEAAVMACTSCATLVEFPTVTKPGLSVSADDRRPALTFSFDKAAASAAVAAVAAAAATATTGTEHHGDNVCNDDAWHIVLQEIPTTAADVAASDRTNMTVGYHHWDAGTALGHWVVQRAARFQGATVLEIGSGLGLPGILAAAVADTESCTLSDFNPKIVANLQKNVDINDVYFSGLGRPGPTCTRLDWDHLDALRGTGRADKADDFGRDGDVQLPPCGSVDMMLGSDIICQDSDCIGICRTLVHFLKPGTGTAVFICGGTRNRYGIDKFPAACKAAGLALEMGPVGEDVLAGIAKNQTHNSRPHDDLTLFQVKLLK